MPIIPAEQIASRIFLFRKHEVMLDSDLAALYGVSTAALNQGVKRNPEGFPKDFAFQLKQKEQANLISQIVISSGDHGGRRTPPMVFTEQGVAMLSSILRSPRAAQMNVAIMRAFVRLRELLITDKELARKVQEHDRKITVLIATVQDMLTLPAPKKKKIGFTAPDAQH